MDASRSAIRDFNSCWLSERAVIDRRASLFCSICFSVCLLIRFSTHTMLSSICNKLLETSVNVCSASVCKILASARFSWFSVTVCPIPSRYSAISLSCFLSSSICSCPFCAASSFPRSILSERATNKAIQTSPTITDNKAIRGTLCFFKYFILILFFIPVSFFSYFFASCQNLPFWRGTRIKKEAILYPASQYVLIAHPFQPNPPFPAHHIAI